MIEVRDLVKRYGGNTAVDHLSFKVEKGQIYGFLGPNGAGKSTTMNIITGYLGLTEGEVIINGHNILEEPEEAKRSIGYLPEQPPLYNDMTAREYLEFAAELKGLPKQDREDAVLKTVELTGIESVIDRLIKNLSKGYRQRVGLAQALLGFPEILILDEPTVGLDPKQILEIRELILSLAKEHTIILSSHILSEVQEVCDHVLIINNGKLIASGTPKELEQQMKSMSTELVVKARDMDRVNAVFSELQGVSSVTCSPTDNRDEISVKIEPQDKYDLRESIFFACVKADLPLLLMRPARVSLEGIFLELTADEMPTAGLAAGKSADTNTKGGQIS